jgi:cell wall-associated NlpC family hydrolase
VSVSGLDRRERHHARDIAVHAMRLTLDHAAQVHYTQGSDRWEGVAHRLDARHGHFPRHGDCSSTTSWALYVALHLEFGLGDIVNGDGWHGGFTGTQAQHGRRIVHTPLSGHRDNTLRADLVLYGRGPTFEHVAMVVGHRNGKPYVISHGSEAGPFFLPFDYRGDAAEFRRYI